MHSYAPIARSGGPDKPTLMKRFDWVERMKIDLVYSSIEDSVLTFLMRMSATTGGTRSPASGVDLEDFCAPSLKVSLSLDMSN